MNVASWVGYVVFSIFILWGAGHSFAIENYVSLVAACAIWAIVTAFVLVVQLASSFQSA